MGKKAEAAAWEENPKHTIGLGVLFSGEYWGLNTRPLH